MNYLILNLILSVLSLNYYAGAISENLNLSDFNFKNPFSFEIVQSSKNESECFTINFKSINYSMTESCNSGGEGSTSCSISVLSVECSVTCGNGYYSCCSLTRVPSCGCIPNNINQLPEGG